ncbi:four helix bundle protein [Pontibacter russatus]|uniref:hypothetical protein n=1 Tax=Pontibacter russatus TaxID=2694929 RepID=UPI001F34AD44|nr:hypothetical protein [Pontibacter russatus]
MLSSSVAANYRAACRASSTAEFAAKVGVVLEESGIVPAQRLAHLKQEATELTAILSSIRKSSTNKKATL